MVETKGFLLCIFALRSAVTGANRKGRVGERTKLHGIGINIFSLAFRVGRREAMALHQEFISESGVHSLCSHCQLIFCFVL